MNAKTEEKIAKVCDEIKDMLVRKNRAYGDSALNPVRIFSDSGKSEQIRVRIDDKLSRIVRRGEGHDDEDVVTDLIGYLVLLKVAGMGGDEVDSVFTVPRDLDGYVVCEGGEIKKVE